MLAQDFHSIVCTFFAPVTAESQAMNEAFESWLIETCTSPGLTESELSTRLEPWQNAPNPRYCHPREEHLLPLHVCYGMARRSCTKVFEMKIMGKKASAYLR